MEKSFLFVDVTNPTWLAYVAFLVIAVFFRFGRILTIRNLDLTLLLLLSTAIVVAGVYRNAPFEKPSEPSATAEMVLTSAQLGEKTTEEGAADPGSVEEEPAAAGSTDSIAAGNLAGMIVEPEASSPATGESSERGDVLESIESAAATPEKLVHPVYQWATFTLMGLTLLLLVRLVFDETFTRRPRLDQNLNQAGITFLCIPAFAILMISVLTKSPEGSTFKAVEHGRALLARRDVKVDPQTENSEHPAPTETLIAAGGAAMAQLSGNLPKSQANNPQSEINVTAWLARIFVVVAHTLVVLGLLSIGKQHFASLQIGISMSCLYLLLPCTAVNVHELNHVLPAACLIWAIASYRNPVVSGILLGLASGTLFFAAFLLPLWAVFYGRNGGVRFVVSVLGITAVLITSLLMISGDASSFTNKLVSTANWTVYRLLDDSATATDASLSQLFIRIPMAAVFFVMLTAMTVLPRPRNLENLLANSTCLVVAAQMWYPDDIGTYVLWYLPLFLIVIFRPRLDRFTPPESAERESSVTVPPVTTPPAPAITMSELSFCLALLYPSFVCSQTLPFTVETTVIHQELSPDFCWFHPRMASIPGLGSNKPILICTLQKHLGVSDHYSGLYFMRSDDGGAVWTKPTLPKELDWRTVNGENIAVCDVTPGWHRESNRLIAVGVKLRYSATGEQLLDQPRSHQCAYATYDPSTDQWTEWKMLALPDEETRHYLVAPGCVQWLVRPDGTLLIPMYFRDATSERYQATVLHCRFDGTTMELISKGDDLGLEDGRGLYEPSLALFQGTYYLTLRNDSGGYVTTSQDGLHFEPVQPWTFDDGSDLGSYNTQQHWLVHNQSLFLSYTRRGANNDHIPRNRAPIFMAQVDPQKLHVLRATEQILIPERGVMLGNFGAAAITAQESWVTDAEYYMGSQPHEKGANGSVYAAKVRWSQPNQLATVAPRKRIVVLGDSITKGVRTGVTLEQTFGVLLENALRENGHSVDVLNHGIGGERTDQALARLSRDILSLEPTLVTIMYGTNDSYVDKDQKQSRLSQDRYAANLKAIVKHLQRMGIKTILMTEPRWGQKAANGLGENPNERLEPFMDSCRLIAKETDSGLVDHFRHWTEAEVSGTNLSQWTTDECHPNPTGHKVLADTMLPIVLKALQD